MSVAPSPAGVAVRVFGDDTPSKTLSLSFGLETLGGVDTVIIPRGTPLPATRSETFSTAADDQSSVELHVLVGERPRIVDDVDVGTFTIIDIPPAPRGVPKLEVTFSVDDHGTFRIAARDSRTGKPQPITAAKTLAAPLTRARIDALVDPSGKP